MKEESMHPEHPRQKTRPARKNFGSIAKGNRWTGKPHENKREVERRLRQSKRNAA